MLHRALGVACIVAGLCVILGSPSSAETVLDYNRLLESTARTLDSAAKMESARPGSAQQVIDRLSGAVPSRMALRTPDGTINADLSPISRGIRELARLKGKQRTGKLASLIARVKAMRSVAYGPGAVDPRQRANADATLRQVLAGAQYQPSRVDDLRQWFMGLIADLFSRMSLSPQTANTIGMLLLVLLVIGLVALLVFICLRVIAYYSVKKPKSARSAVAHVVRRKAPSAASALEAAEEQAAAGRYREAYRSAYLAAILTLDRAKLVKYVDGTTNWEYLRALSRQPNNGPIAVFQEMTTAFDELIYGKREVSSDDYQACVSKYRSLEDVVR